MAKLNLALLTALAVLSTIATPIQAEVLIGVPLTNDPGTSRFNKNIQLSAERAFGDLNAKGGVLGEPLKGVFDLDDCKADPAVTVAKKFMDQGVVFVVGHICSGSAIAAAKIYEQAKIVMISATATNPKLTDEGSENVFRVSGRDDDQGPMGAHYLKEQWGDDKIAILHDGKAFGQGLAEQIKASLNQMSVQEAMFEAYPPEQDDYSDLIAALKAAEIDVAYIGGQTGIGLIARQARDQGYKLQIVGGDSLQSPGFADVAGAAAEGVLFTAPRDPRGEPEAAEVMSALRADGLDEPIIPALYTYAAIQTWAQAVEAAGSFEVDAVSKALHGAEFNTVIGKVVFDDNGDVTESGFEWFIWTKDGPVPKK